MDKLDQIIAQLAVINTTVDETKKSVASNKGRLTKLENAPAPTPAAAPTAPPAPDMSALIANEVKATMSDDKRRGEFMTALDLETIEAAERAAAAEVDSRLWQESKVKYAGRKLRQHGPTLAVGVAAGVGGVVAFQRYSAAAEDLEVAEPVSGSGNLKVAK